MKNFVFLLIVLLSTLAFAGDLDMQNCDRQGVVLQWKLDSYKISTVGEYTVVEFPGGSGIYGIGQPALPSQQAFLEMPQGAQAVITLSGVEVVNEQVEKPIVPTQEPDIDTIGERNLARTFAMDTEVYSSADPFPSKVVEIAYQGIMRGRNLILLRVNPIQYLPAKREIRIYTRMTIHVDFKGGRETVQTDDAMDPIASALVLNYQPGTARRGGEVDYLVLTVPEMEENASKFCEWKKQKGLTTKVEVLSRGADVSTVKDAIKKYYPEVKFVLILADHGQIKLPSNGNRHPLGIERCQQLGLEDGSVPSDNYYACVDGDDYYPDVYIGRIPANNPEEADILIGKLEKYQKAPPKGDWAKRFLLCGEFQYQWGTKNMAERLFCETAFCIWNSLHNKYIFPAKTVGTGSSGMGHSEYFFRKAKNPNDPTKPGTYRDRIRDDQGPVVNCKMPTEWTENIVSDREAKSNVLAFWNEGCFWVQHRDHGGNTSWGKPSLNKSDMQNLHNGDKLPVLFSINCLTGSMDYSSDCFVEAALKNKNGGAVAAIGSTRVSYSWWNDRLCDGLYTCVFGVENYDCFDTGIKLPSKHPFSKKMGVVLNFGKMYLALNYPSNPWGTSYDYTETEFYLFHVIGDPEMTIWTKALTEIDAKYDRTKSALKVSVIDQNRNPVKGATVCLYNGKEQIVGHTDGNGICAIPATYAPGVYTVTITGDDIYPYQKSMKVN